MKQQLAIVLPTATASGGKVIGPEPLGDCPTSFDRFLRQPHCPDKCLGAMVTQKSRTGERKRYIFIYSF